MTPEAAKATPINLDGTMLTAADLDAASTFRESFSFGCESSDDEETGLANSSVAAVESASKVQDRRHIRWIVGGAAVFLLIIGLSIGLMTKNKGDTSAVKESATPESPIVTDVQEKESISPFEPQETTSDSAQINWPEDVSTASVTTASPTMAAPADNDDLPRPIDSVIASSPTLAPSISPTMKPTPAPSAEPSMKPTPKPSAVPTERPSMRPTEAPTDEPTKKPSVSPTKKPTPEPTNSPVVELDLSGWGAINWSGETSEPTASPSETPTPEPTPPPTTSEPTKEPTPAPSSPPTPEPSKKPTVPPTPEPSKKPTVPPTPEPTPSPTLSPTTAKPTENPTPKNPYFMGDEFYTHSSGCANIEVSRGLKVRLIAQTGAKVEYANGDKSKDSWHTRTDAAGIISMNPEDPLNSGYAYLSNSEEGDGKGGVYGLYFDKDGNIEEYKPLLTKTTDNCGGGLTPWNTFVSCEEYSDGQCWQIDAISGEVKETVLGGDGGRYESVAVDNRNAENPAFFTTEDHEEGALRRFVADGNGWDALHSGGETTFLEILDDSTFTWTDSLNDGKASAMRYFPNTEGVQVHEGKVYFMAKKLRRLLILDLDTETYVTETTGKKFYGEGDFGDQPDQNLFGPSRKYLYFTEDGGKNPGVYARYGTDETYFTMFQGNLDEEDETVGIALSPDHTVFYAGLQDHGCIYEFRREDGLPFE